jgi:hypothetical protein
MTLRGAYDLKDFSPKFEKAFCNPYPGIVRLKDRREPNKYEN